jgi:biopolymer transport protein ExbB/TolQ
MRTRSVLIVFALLLIFSVSAAALERRCVVVGSAGSELAAIAREAAEAKKLADELEAYLRSASPHWLTMAYQMGYLEARIRNLRNSIGRFERLEPQLDESQKQQLERLKAGLGTLTLFANQTNRLIGEKQLWPHRDALLGHARAMAARADVIRKAARELRVAELA